MNMQPVDNHTQRVVNNGSLLNWKDSLIGIRKGSALGLVLFSIFTNKIKNTEHIKFLHFIPNWERKLFVF